VLCANSVAGASSRICGGRVSCSGWALVEGAEVLATMGSALHEKSKERVHVVVSCSGWEGAVVLAIVDGSALHGACCSDVVVVLAKVEGVALWGRTTHSGVSRMARAHLVSGAASNSTRTHAPKKQVVVLARVKGSALRGARCNGV